MRCALYCWWSQEPYMNNNNKKKLHFKGSATNWTHFFFCIFQEPNVVFKVFFFFIIRTQRLAAIGPWLNSFCVHIPLALGKCLRCLWASSHAGIEKRVLNYGSNIGSLCNFALAHVKTSGCLPRETQSIQNVLRTCILLSLGSSDTAETVNMFGSFCFLFSLQLFEPKPNK